MPGTVQKKWMSRAAVAGLCLLADVSLVQAADWPVIHGNMDHTGVTSEQLTLPLGLSWMTQSDQPPSPAFYKGLTGKHPTDAACQDYVYQTVIAGNRLYFGTSTDEAVVCLDTDTGAQEWKVYVDGALRMAPTLDGGKVYAGTDGGSVYCLDGASGEELWRFRAGPTNYSCVGHSRVMSSWPVRSGVLLTNGVAYFAAGVYPTAGTYLYAVNAATGEQLWQQQIQITPNGTMKIVDGDKLWLSSGRVAPYEFRLSDGAPLMPDPDRRGARGGWWIGDVDGLPAWGPADNALVLFRLATNAPPGTWLNSSATQANTLPNGIISGLHGYCAFGADKFYLLGENNTVMAVPLAAFRAACTNRVNEILALSKWDYGWVMAREVEDDAPFTAALTAGAAWTTTVPVSGSGDLVWGIVAGTHLFFGGDNEVVALDSSTGNKVWSYAVDGEARGLAVADGALFVSTDTGKIYCFRNGTETPITHTPSFSNPYANDPVYADAATTAVAAAGRTKGVCVVLGAGEGELAYQISQQSDFFVVCLDKDTNQVAAARAKLAQAGVYGSRVVVYHEPNDIPDYANYMANLVVSDEAISTGTVPYSPQGAFRLVQPYSGTILFGSGAGINLDGWSQPQLSSWTPTNGASGVTWQVARRGKLPRAGEWTHAYGNSANTVSSHDRLVSTNLQVQWFGAPGMPDMVDRHKMSVSPLVKNGKMFRSGSYWPTQSSPETTLTAIDVYNGTTLWTTELLHSGRLQAGHNTHPYTCIGDSIFATSYDVCYELDATSGQQLHEFDGTLPGYDWGYVGGLNQYLIGTSQSHGVDRETYTVRNFSKTFSDTSSRPASSRDLFVYDLTTNEKLWTYSGGAILNVSITVNEASNTLYFIESRNATGMSDTTGQIEFSDFLADNGARIVAMDLQTGDILWTQPITRNITYPHQWIMYLTYADGVLLASRTYFTGTSGDYGYDFEALDASDGTSLWQVWKQSPGGSATWKNPLHSHPFYASGKFYFMARYYGAVYSFDPHTGAETVDATFGTGWEQAEAKSCSTPMASETAFYYRRNSHHLYDLETQKSQDITRVSRPGCWMSIIPAGGVVTMMEQSKGCTCGFSVQLSAVFAPKFLNGEPPNVSPGVQGTNVTCDAGVPVEFQLTATDGDDDELTFTVNSPPAHGTLTGVNPDTGEVAYSPAGGFTGTDTFTFSASDGFVNSPSATATIHVLNSGGGQITASTGSVSVPEGGTATFDLKLSLQPEGSVTVQVERVVGGDTDLTVQSGSPLFFTTNNWATNQVVTLSANRDDDWANSSAVFRCSSPGLADASVTATEIDDDTDPAYSLPWAEPFEALTAGTLAGQHGWAGGGTVQADTVQSGTQALALTNETAASHVFTGDSTNIWISFWMQGNPCEAAPEDIDVDTVAAMYVNASSNLVAYSNQTPVELSAQVSNGWNKIDIFADYVSKVWNLSLNGVELFDNFEFYSDRSAFSAVKFVELSTHAMYIDDIGITDSLDDSDGDGLPDSWEESYWPGDLTHSPNDPSSNGINTVLQAYIAGLDPTDPDSTFLVSNLHPLTSESVLHWQNASGRVYSIWWTSNLLYNFHPLETNCTSGVFTDTVHGADEKGFYKIEVGLE